MGFVERLPSITSNGAAVSPMMGGDSRFSVRTLCWLSVASFLQSSHPYRNAFMQSGIHWMRTMTTQNLQNLIAAGADLLDDKAAAAILDVSPGTLSVWRSTGRYALPVLKIGRKVRYRRADLDAWLAARVRESGATA